MVQEPPCSADGPRNIVLLSDGTGNSAASLRRTNVWRIYEALDLSSGDQLALYDNGVGTSTFRPLAMLGGALGWGLKRNVRDLYVFACRNYRPPLDRPKPEKSRPADRIYALGFSRGAFTIRVLVDLIGNQGLITSVTGRELDLLEYLLRHQGHHVSREMLARDVWKEPRRATPIDNVIDVQMTRLRKKVDAEGAVRLIHTVRGVGFVLQEGEP